MQSENRRTQLNIISRLRVDRATGDPAPHKPLLLLVVLDLAERGELQDVLRLTPELAFRFSTFWSIVAHRRSQRPDVRLPFHHTSSDGLWTPLDSNLQPCSDRRATRYAQLNPSFLEFARDADCREEARRVLIERYFRPEERVALYAMLQMDLPTDDGLVGVLTQAEGIQATCKGRDARFRLDVVAAYEYRCALTQHRLLTIDVGSIVDAAHIHPFSNSRNDDPRNGMALCKNAHWLFDLGLWSVTDDYRVIVARDSFVEDNPYGRMLLDFEGEKLHLPASPAIWPDPHHLQWHRTHCFRRD